MMDFKCFKTRMFLGILSMAFVTNASAIDIKIDDGNVLTNAEINSIVIDDETDMVFVTTVSGNFNITQDEVDPGDPVPQVSLQVNGGSSASVLVGTAVNLSWVISDAASCSTAVGNTAWQAVNIGLTGGADTGNTNIVVDYADQTRNFQLTCINGANTTTRTVQVTGEADDPPPPADSCPEDYTPPLSGDVYSWGGFFNEDFPGPQNREPLLTVPRAGYRALEFNTGSDAAGQDGSIRSITYHLTFGGRELAISKCAGDFYDHLPGSASRCSDYQFNGGTLNWSLENTPTSWECKLEPNTTYFLNVTFTDGLDPSTDRCSGSVCRTYIRHANF